MPQITFLYLHQYSMRLFYSGCPMLVYRHQVYATQDTLTVIGINLAVSGCILAATGISLGGRILAVIVIILAPSECILAVSGTAIKSIYKTRL